MRVAAGEIVGTYRMLPPERARAAGALYAEGEFVIDDLAPLRRSLVETGRSCVHRDIGQDISAGGVSRRPARTC